MHPDRKPIPSEIMAALSSSWDFAFTIIPSPVIKRNSNFIDVLADPDNIYSFLMAGVERIRVQPLNSITPDDSPFILIVLMHFLYRLCKISSSIQAAE